MDAADRSNRTWLCTVVFIDIVEYSQQTVTQQIAFKDYLNRCISRAVKHINVNDRIILDTGDGAALCFMGDPEEALFVALGLRDALVDQGAHEAYAPLVRIGINLGPARIVRDINGQLNIIGDGINVAQRVMSFAQPNQVLVSRSFYEVISRLSQEYDKLFRYQGLHKDKHVREHAVYEVVVMRAGDPLAVAAEVTETCESLEPEEPFVEATELSWSMHSWDKEVLQTATTHLAHYIGPLAQVLVQRAARQTADVNELYRLLAEAIPEEREQRLFLGTQQSLPQQDAKPPVSVAPPASPHHPSGSTWDAALLQTVADRLVQYLGPVATILVRREAKKAKDVQELYHALAAHISVDQERKRFLHDLAAD
jgi:class 3 adenylate cyclase